MELWRPPEDSVQLHEWWLPLIAASKRARQERIPWPVHVDEFALEGRVDRGRRPSVWVYVHGESAGELLADLGGSTYTFVHHRSGRSPGRFREIDVRTAVWKAGLPDHVEPVEYDPPGREHVSDGWEWSSRHPAAPGRLRLVVSNGP